VHKVPHLIGSTFLTRWVGPRHATLVSLSPSNPVRPRRTYYNYSEEHGKLSTDRVLVPDLLSGIIRFISLRHPHPLNVAGLNTGAQLMHKISSGTD
jgi:hypothetical protein